MKKIYLSALSIILGASLSAQVSNPGFEDWTSGDPDNWETLNEAANGPLAGDATDGNGNAVTPANEETINATEGNSYIKLTSFQLDNSLDQVNYPDRDYGSTAIQTFASTDKYEDFSMDVSYDIIGNDKGLILIEATNANGEVVAQAVEQLSGSGTTLTTMNFPLSFSGDVTEYTIALASSENEILGNNTPVNPGSWIAVDNIVEGTILIDPPNVSNVMADDIGDNHNGTDLRVTFEVPNDETNIDAYYLAVFATPDSPAQLANLEAFFTTNGLEVTPDGSDQTYEFGATDEYWKYNQNTNSFESAEIAEDIEYKVYVFVKGSGATYGNVLEESNAITLTSEVAVDKYAKEAINVYPNPANNYVNFKIDGLENGNLTVKSITGQEVVNTSFNNSIEKIDVNHLKNGVYIYSIQNQNGEIIKTNKLVIQK